MKHRKLATGFYIPTETFKSIPEHIAVMFEDNQTLVAICGPSDDDPDNLVGSIAYSRKFAAVDDLLEVLKELTAHCTYMNNMQHAGQDMLPIDWSTLYDLQGRARTIIQKIEEEQ